MAKRGIVTKTEAREIDKRPIRWRKYEHFFLIVCEDSNVEPYYFDTFKSKFPDETFFLKAVGTGRSTKGVVEQALKEKEALFIESNNPLSSSSSSGVRLFILRRFSFISLIFN